MANEIKPVNPGLLSPNVKPASVELKQDGNNNTQIAQVEHYHNQNTTVIIAAGQHEEKAATQGTLNTEYYNLFVMGNEQFSQFSQGKFLVEKGRALTENVSEDIKEAICHLPPEAIEFLKTLPTIFCAENEDSSYGKSTDSQQAYFGFITDINVQNRGIKICYNTLNSISQKNLNEMLIDLDIEGNEKFNEFDRTHWTVKHVPLVKVLREAGITVYAP